MGANSYIWNLVYQAFEQFIFYPAICLNFWLLDKVLNNGRVAWLRLTPISANISKQFSLSLDARLDPLI